MHRGLTPAAGRRATNLRPMSPARSTTGRPGAATIIHPAFIRDRLAPLFSAEASATRAGPRRDHTAFNRWRARVGTAVPSVGSPHPGRKGRIAFQVKRIVARTVYWYVDPVVARLAESIRDGIDVTESISDDVNVLQDEVAALRREVASLRRDLDRDAERHRPSAPSTVSA